MMNSLKLFIFLTFTWTATHGEGIALISRHRNTAFQTKFENERRQNFEHLGARRSLQQFHSSSFRFDLWNLWNKRKHKIFRSRRTIAKANRPIMMNVDKLQKKSEMLSFTHSFDKLSVPTLYGNSKRNIKISVPVNEEILLQRCDLKNSNHTKEIQRIDYQDVFSKNQDRKRWEISPEARNIHGVLYKYNKDIQADILTQDQNIEQIKIEEDRLEKQTLRTIGTKKVFTINERKLFKNIHPRLHHGIIMKQENKISFRNVILKNVQKLRRQRRMKIAYKNVKTLSVPNLMLFSKRRMPFWLIREIQPIQFDRGRESSIASQQRRPKSLMRIRTLNLEKAKANKRFSKKCPIQFIKTNARREVQKLNNQLLKKNKIGRPSFNNKPLVEFLTKPYQHYLTRLRVPPYLYIFQGSRRNQSPETKVMHTPNIFHHISFALQATNYRTLSSKAIKGKQPRRQSINKVPVNNYNRPTSMHSLHFISDKSLLSRSWAVIGQKPYPKIPDYDTDDYFKSHEGSRFLVQNYVGEAATRDSHEYKTLELKDLTLGERFDPDFVTYKSQRNLLDQKKLIPSHGIKSVQNSKKQGPIFEVQLTHAVGLSSSQRNLRHNSRKATMKRTKFYQQIMSLMHTELSLLFMVSKTENGTFQPLAKLCTWIHSNKNDSKSERRSSLKDIPGICNMVKQPVFDLKINRKPWDKLTEKLSLFKKIGRMLVKGADLIWSLIAQILCLMKHAAQILFSQISVLLQGDDEEKLNRDVQMININMIAHSGKKVLHMTDDSKPLVSNRTLKYKTWFSLPVPLTPILDKTNTNEKGRFLVLIGRGNRQSSAFKKKKVENSENKEKSMKTSSFTGLNISSFYRNPPSEYHKHFLRKSNFALFLRYKNLNRKRQKTPVLLNKHEITTNASKRRRDVSKKTILHKSKTIINVGKVKEKATGKVLKNLEHKYILSKPRKLSRKEKDIIYVKIKRPAGKEVLNYLFSAFIIPRFSAKTKKRETDSTSRTNGVRPASRKELRRRRRATQTERFLRLNKGAGRSNRHKDYHSRELDPSSRRAGSQYADDNMIDPFPYSEKNLNDLPDGNTQDLQIKLLKLMELARKKDKDDQIKENDSNQTISKPPINAYLARHLEKSSIKSITSSSMTKPNGRGKTQHRKHPTSAERKLLHNIELLIFLVLDKENNSAKSLPEKWRTREKKPGLQADSNNELRTRIHLKRIGSGKGKWTKVHKRRLIHKRAIELQDNYNTHDIHSLHNMAGVDLDNDYLDTYVRTEVNHNTFPERWKTLKTQLSLLNKQMTRTRTKYTSIQKKIKGLLKEGESLAKKVINKIDRSETDEAKARSKLEKLENQRKKIESKIRDEEEKRDRVEEQFMRSGITGKVNDIKDELSKEDYQLQGEDSLEHVDFNPPAQKRLTHQVVSHVASFGNADDRDNDNKLLDSADDLVDIEPRNELKTVQVETKDSKRDDELHLVDQMLDKLLENRIKRSSEGSGKYKQKRDKAVKKYTGKARRVLENVAGDVANKDNTLTKIGTFLEKYESAFENKNEGEDNKENDLKEETDEKKNFSEDDTEVKNIKDSEKGQVIKKYESESKDNETGKETNKNIIEKEMRRYDFLTEAEDIMSNEKDNGIDDQKEDETTINKRNMNKRQNGGTDKSNTQVYNVLNETSQRTKKDFLTKRKPEKNNGQLEKYIEIKGLGENRNDGQLAGKRSNGLREYDNDGQLDDGRTIESDGTDNNGQSDNDKTVKESKETIQQNRKDPKNTKKKKKTLSVKEQRFEGHRRKVNESNRKFLDLQSTIKEATKDLNFRFGKIKEERENLWEEKYKERKDKEEKEAKILSDLMKDIDNEVSWLKNVQAEEVESENEFLQEANRDLKKNREEEQRLQKQRM